VSDNRSFRFIEGDLLRVDLPELLYDVDSVFHLAARPGVRSSWDDFEWALKANVMATRRLLHAMVRKDNRARLVFASSSSVYGSAISYPTTEADLLHPISPYGVTKASAEQLISAYDSQYGLEAVILRYFTVYGPRQRPDMAFSRWISAARAGRPLTILGNGTAERDFTYVDDIVDATVLALTAPPSIYNIAGGSPTPIKEALSLISELTGSDLDIRYEDRASGDPLRTAGDTTRIRQAVSWRPQVPLRDGLARQIVWADGGQ
jgi:nucleoside-diphosphate-sugar epimerase